VRRVFVDSSSIGPPSVRNSIMPVNGPFDLVVMALANIGIFD
jgi:hypothetical protein